MKGIILNLRLKLIRQLNAGQCFFIISPDVTDPPEIIAVADAVFIVSPIERFGIHFLKAPALDVCE